MKQIDCGLLILRDKLGEERVLKGRQDEEFKETLENDTHDKVSNDICHLIVSVLSLIVISRSLPFLCAIKINFLHCSE